MIEGRGDHRSQGHGGENPRRVPRTAGKESFEHQPTQGRRSNGLTPVEERNQDPSLTEITGREERYGGDRPDAESCALRSECHCGRQENHHGRTRREVVVHLDGAPLQDDDHGGEGNPVEEGREGLRQCSVSEDRRSRQHVDNPEDDLVSLLVVHGAPIRGTRDGSGC